MESTNLARVVITVLVVAGLLVAVPAVGSAQTNGGSSAAPSASGDGDEIVLRRDGSKAVPFVDLSSPSTDGERFDWGDAAIGAGVGAFGAIAAIAAAVGMRRHRAVATARPVGVGTAE